MLFPSFHNELPRQLIAKYLLVGLAIVAWFGLGIVLITQSVISERFERTSLSVLRAAGSAVTLDYLRHGDANLQQTVSRIRGESAAVYCAVISTNNRFLAHSSSAKTGLPAQNPVGKTTWCGEIQRIRFDEGDRTLREYRIPLAAGKESIGTLTIAVIEPTLWSTVRQTSSYAWWSLLAPLTLIGLGAWALVRIVRPLSEIENQLRRAATATAISGLVLDEVTPTGAAASGWNRLVEELARAAQPPFEARLSEAFQGFRQKKLDEVLGSLPDGVVVTDSDGEVALANRPTGILAGVSHEELTGTKMVDALTSAWTVPADSPLCGVQAAEREVVEELEREESKERKFLRVARYPVRTQTGTLSGHVWSLRDVTQQKLAEQMRNQFVDSATHELRTPLANIKAYAETLTLCDGGDVEQQREFINTINSEATRLARFVDDLLSISSMEVGSLKLNKSPTDMARVLQEVIGWVRPQMDQKNLVFETVFPEKIPELNIDKDKLTATLVNLLGNAAKYTPDGGRVGVRVRVTEASLEVDVEDSGIGISKEELPKVFEKFFRSKNPQVQDQTGTGLGLSLAFEVIRLHGGRLSVHSELHKGSTFTMSVPLS